MKNFSYGLLNDKNDLISKSSLEFPRKTMMTFQCSQNQKEKAREEKNNSVVIEFKLQTHKQKNPKDFNGY